MINPCLSIVNYKKGVELTLSEFYTFLLSTARVPEIVKDSWLTDGKDSESLVLASGKPEINSDVVVNIIKNPGCLCCFDYKKRAKLLYGCVVVYAYFLDPRFCTQSITHFLLT